MIITAIAIILIFIFGLITCFSLMREAKTKAELIKLSVENNSLRSDLEFIFGAIGEEETLRLNIISTDSWKKYKERK